MNRPRKPLLRMAMALHQRCLENHAQQQAIELPCPKWDESMALVSLIERAQQKNWHLAAARLQSDLGTKLQQLNHKLCRLHQDFQTKQQDPALLTVHSLYADMIAIEEEFEDLTFDLKAQSLSVTTQSITLEGIDLGPFQICFEWGKFQFHYYSVIALEPNRAASDSSVTHPHVQNEAVCEGEGRIPIEKALEQGRFYDFFVIVANILKTYNSESPFVALDCWDGMSCGDCNSTISDDEQYGCGNCGAVVCEHCHYHCDDCECNYCSECIFDCESCDKNYCYSCLKTCGICKKSTCKACLDDQERCTDCHDQDTEDEKKETETTETVATTSTNIPAIQSNGLGQTALPTRLG